MLVIVMNSRLSVRVIGSCHGPCAVRLERWEESL